MRTPLLSLALAGCLWQVAACESGEPGDDNDSPFARPRIGGPTSDFPARESRDASTPIVSAGGLGSPGGITGGGVTPGGAGAIGGGGTGGAAVGGSADAGGSYSPERDGGLDSLDPGADAGDAGVGAPDASGPSDAAADAAQTFAEAGVEAADACFERP